MHPAWTHRFEDPVTGVGFLRDKEESPHRLMQAVRRLIIWNQIQLLCTVGISSQTIKSRLRKSILWIETFSPSGSPEYMSDAKQYMMVYP